METDQSNQSKIYILKHLIINSDDAGPKTKRACLALIDASDNMTKPVFITVFSKKAAYGIENLNCSSRNTRLYEKTKELDLPFHFSHHDGYFSESEGFKVGIYPGKKITHTIWLSSVSYDPGAAEATEEMIKRTGLPGLANRIPLSQKMRALEKIIIIFALAVIALIIFAPRDSRMPGPFIIGMSLVIFVAMLGFNYFAKKFNRERRYRLALWCWLLIAAAYLLKVCGLF